MQADCLDLLTVSVWAHVYRGPTGPSYSNFGYNTSGSNPIRLQIVGYDQLTAFLTGAEYVGFSFVNEYLVFQRMSDFVEVYRLPNAHEDTCRRRLVYVYSHGREQCELQPRKTNSSASENG